MNQQKADFLKKEFTTRLTTIDPQTSPAWGKMNFQQMVEHMTEYVLMGAGEPPMKLVTPEEHLPKMQAFLMSENPFRENTPNVLLPDTPPAVRREDSAAAINELQQAIDHFFDVFTKEPDKKVMNPFFGELDFALSVQLLHKHAVHHLKQFGNIIE